MNLDCGGEFLLEKVQKELCCKFGRTVEPGLVMMICEKGERHCYKIIPCPFFFRFNTYVNK